MWAKSFYLFIFVFRNTVAQSDEECGKVTLTYFLRENRIAARLTFVPNTKLMWYRWVHFFIENGAQPDFDFQKAWRSNSSKYENQNYSVIIKDLQESDTGVYNIECIDLNGSHLASARLKIDTPYTLETTPITSTLESVPNRSGYVRDKAKSGADLKPTTETCNLCEKTDTTSESDRISSTDQLHSTQTDLALKPTTINETTHIFVRGIRPRRGEEENKSSKEQKLLTKESVLLASGCTIVGVLLTLAVVLVVKKMFTNSRRSNEEASNRKTHGCILTTMKDQTKEYDSVFVNGETRRELQTSFDPSTQDPYSTLTLINASNENVYSELEEQQPLGNEYTNV